MAGRREWTRESLVSGIREGDRRALARAITLVENGDPLAGGIVHDLYPGTGRARTIGVTGPPGVGKSSLIAALVRHARVLGETAGVISVDPSSPFSQGALLGDRIRLSDHFLDPGVFIRSMGTRGHLGGLAEATLQALLLLDAAGKDVVFVETVGTGQSEVEVARVADTVLLVLMPGSGDSIQALKAGIMEIPDVIAVNKLDSPGGENDGGGRPLDPRPRPRARLEAADRAYGGAARGRRGGAVGQARRAPLVPRDQRAARRAAARAPRSRGLCRLVGPCEGAPRACRARRSRASPAC